jgi:hypothetical protein
MKIDQMTSTPRVAAITRSHRRKPRESKSIAITITGITIITGTIITGTIITGTIITGITITDTP